MSNLTYYIVLSFISILSILILNRPSFGIKDKLIESPSSRYGIIIAVIAAIMMGLQPVLWGTYADRENYAILFQHFKTGNIYLDRFDQDILFYLYMFVLSKFVDLKLFIIITALIYVFNYVVASMRLSRNYSFILILFVLISFMFYDYGTNTIRAGFALSFIVLAISNYNHLGKLLLFLLIAIGCHFSTIIPAIAILLAKYYNNTKFYLFVWLIAIPVSAFSGDFFNSWFSTLSSDDRISYLNYNPNKTIYNVGFRIDFIIYSCIPILFGYYYIYRKRFFSTLYSQIFNAYIIVNAFWILVIRANYSDRFAYLSWFLIPFIIIYPLLNKKIFANQNRKIALIIFIQLIFTCYMQFR